MFECKNNEKNRNNTTFSRQNVIVKPDFRYLCSRRNWRTADGIRRIHNRKVMDRLTKEQRHKCMASIRSRDTKPELLVRRYLWREGFRYRLNNPRLPGHPDLVLRKYRTCIFVNGCFWHGHENCDFFKLPRTNTTFWQAKIERNRMRDKAERQRLAQMGWHVIVVWECELKPKRRDETLRSLVFTLNEIFLRDHSVNYKPIEEENETAMAAEDLHAE